MHEYPVTEHIIKLACAKAAENNTARVAAINLVMGENCGYLPDSIMLYFDIIAADTVCKNAKINIKSIKPKLRCNACGNLFLRQPFKFGCPNPDCNGTGEPTEIGREFFLESLEFE
jgi:hydrogenase nickel incorporation protein HypA/HybF